ncbi:MAG: transketolase, partial [Candidatus Thorarchaeota archaeon]
MNPPTSLQENAINTIRFLAADAIQDANSGHPGMPMGAAAMAYTLWTRHLRFNPQNPSWQDRDRFVLSAGHGSMLLYALLYLNGYDLSLEDLKKFRQLDSLTPGHPEYGHTQGVEVTTGPLGQGFANSVGLAIAEAHLGEVFNKPDFDIINHYTYAIVGDGDFMEGMSYETASLAGHLGLGKLVVLYDDNRISIDGSTDITFTEDVAKRFEAQGWHVQKVSDGNDVDAIDKAIISAKKDSRPSLIMCHTNIGYGLPNKQDTAKAHGEPAGEEELKGAKEKLGWPLEPRYHVPEDVLAHFRESVERGENLESDWQKLLDEYGKEYTEASTELLRRFSNELPENWESCLPTFEADRKGVATRSTSGKVLNAIAKQLPELMGGSADLTGSNKTWIEGSPAFQTTSREGRNIFFGVREHAMGAIVNGLAVHGGIIPFAGTFFVFSDYMRPAIRMSALSNYPSIWIYTHDSIGLGEDGPTHQPVEQLMSLRAIPNLVIIRPADANEVTEAWRVAISRRDGPTMLICTRQNVPIFDRTKFSAARGLAKGAYVLADMGEGTPDIILMASGSEVDLIMQAAEKLHSEGVNVRVVSFPSWRLFQAQNQEYRESVLLPNVTARLAVEAGVSIGWERWIGEKGDMISIDTFGTSAPHKVLFEKYGFTVDN